MLITNRSLMYDPVQDKVFDAEADTVKCAMRSGASVASGDPQALQ